jgi:hypothetical protein
VQQAGRRHGNPRPQPVGIGTPLARKLIAPLLGKLERRTPVLLNENSGQFDHFTFRHLIDIKAACDILVPRAPFGAAEIAEPVIGRPETC